MNDYFKTSRDYLEAWRTSQAEMQRLRDALDAEREKVRVLRHWLSRVVQGDFESEHAWQRWHTGAVKALATTAPEGGDL